MQGVLGDLWMILATVLARRPKKKRERPYELTDTVRVIHQHTGRDGRLIWHRHVTLLRDHPMNVDRAHPE